MSKSSFFSNTGPSNTQNTAIASSVSGAAASATAAAASATSAASSAASASANVTNNAASAAASEVSRQASLSAKNAAVVAKSAAETAETNAETAQSASANSATASAASATASEASKATSTTKASEASTSASTASTKAADAETARAAAVVAKDASVSAKDASVAAKVLSVAAKDASVVAKNAAVTAQNNASASAQTATTKASEASTSAATATTKASQAATSATASEASKVTSVNSASTATTKASEASTSAASAAASYDLFDDRMLGAKSSAPTVDNDGGTLVQGTLYFDTSSQTMKVYGSSGWVPAGSSVNGTSARFKFVATNNQTTFSGSDANSQTLGYDAGFLDVYLSGLRLVNGTDFTATTGTNIVLAAGAATGDILEVVAYGTFVLANFNADKLDGQHGSYYTGYTDSAVSALVDSSPAALNTLNELAAALGDDVNFSTTVTNSIATKAALAGATFTGEITANGGIALGDSDKATFGAGDDLEIYHDGSNSYIADTGTGSLNIRSSATLRLQNATGANFLYGTVGGEVGVYHDGNPKLYTTSTGIDVTGTVVADGLDVSHTTGTLGFKIATNDATAANNAGILNYNYASATAGSRHADLIFDASGANASGGDYFVISQKGDTTVSLIPYGAASTLSLGSAGVERMRIDSSGKIQIGNNIPMWSGSFGGAIFLKGNNATADRHIKLAVVNSVGAVDGTKTLVLDNDGDVTIGGGNLVIGTSGKGIDFSATAGSGTSELLDDYEEGTWTPTINFAGSSVGVVYTKQLGHYTKIGRMVYASFDILLSSKGSSNGGITIDGLPIASYGSHQNNAGTIICESGGVSWPQNGVYGMVWSDGNIYVRQQQLTAYASVSDTHCSNTVKIFGMMVYEAT